MFGFVVANPKIMSPEQKSRYRAAYCGVCRAMKRRCGLFARLALQYDMAFLVLLLDSLYEPETVSSRIRCLPHPVKRHRADASPFTDYAGDMNAALAYWKCLDDWRDERYIPRGIEALLLRRSYRRAARKYPRQCAAMQSCMDELRMLEKSGSPSPDAGADAFGALMGEIFAVREDNWAYNLRRLGTELGRFIYIMDAAVDLKKDRKRGRYNALSSVASGAGAEQFRGLLEDMMGRCAREFDRLPLERDADILKNIVFSGVWCRWPAE